MRFVNVAQLDVLITKELIDFKETLGGGLTYFNTRSLVNEIINRVEYSLQSDKKHLRKMLKLEYLDEIELLKLLSNIVEGGLNFLLKDFHGFNNSRNYKNLDMGIIDGRLLRMKDLLKEYREV